MDVEAIRTGIAQVVEENSGLSMSPHEPPQLHPPCGWVATGDPFMPEPHEAFADGLCQIEMVVRVCVSEAAGVNIALAALDPYMGSGTGQAQSVLDAIYTDTSFKAAIPAGNARVISISGTQQLETLGGVMFVGFDIPIRIYAPRT